MNHFLFGDGSPLHFGPETDMSRIIGEVGSFKEFAEVFEDAALKFYRKKGTINGFNGSEIIEENQPKYMGNVFNLFSWAVLGGYRQISAKIKVVTDTKIITEYTIVDHFGAGAKDSWSNIPGLPQMYYLQHYKSDGEKYLPFIWSVTIERERSNEE